MAIPTTCIGSYPKPGYVPIADWFEIDKGLTTAGENVTRNYTQVMAGADEETEALFRRATREAIEDQVACGIDVPTDGEQRRENYIHYHCRHLRGIDFENLTPRVLRDGAYEASLPTITGKIEPKGHHFLDTDFKIAQGFTDRPVKITVPGPLTIIDTTANAHYDTERALAIDLADALNFEIRGLAEAGCKYIQVDEPVFARNVSRALEFGVECLDRCFDGVPGDVTRVMHMCCGYPDHLDDAEYHKADRDSYLQLAGALDKSSVHQISLEDAHRYNDLSLLEKFTDSTVIFGSVAIAKSRVEPVEEIAARLNAALRHIGHDRLIAAPDCGLAMLGRELAMKKLKNLSHAAGSV
ncbi:MAG: cobalamin-independent methionine synthase II family protein [Alphaproteobacteria bacterium]